MTFGGSDFYEVVYGNGMYVAVGGDGAIWTSPDSTTWKDKTETGDGFRGIAYTLLPPK